VTRALLMTACGPIDACAVTVEPACSSIRQVQQAAIPLAAVPVRTRPCRTGGARVPEDFAVRRYDKCT
jgi:hypothetical protein